MIKVYICNENNRANVFDELAKEMTIIPEAMITGDYKSYHQQVFNINNGYSSDELDEDYEVAITKEIIDAYSYLVDLTNLKDLNSGCIKELVHGELFLTYREPVMKRELNIVTSPDVKQSLLFTDPGLKARCEIIDRTK